MGCASSKMAREEERREEREMHLSAHVVSLTSSTYGLLKLDFEAPPPEEKSRRIPAVHPPPIREVPEIINAWELMEGLPDDDEGEEAEIPEKKIPLPGKENHHRIQIQKKMEDLNPRRILQPLKSPPSKPPIKRRSSGGSPLFDPELVAFFEKELGENKKKTTMKKKRMPAGGEEAVVLYTTSLRGIRKTFDDCCRVREVMESHGVRIIERDISMDLGFREELRWVTGRMEIRVPAVFVKGELVGGAEEVRKMEEEGRLGEMLAGMPAAAPPAASAGGGCCDGCGGMRFVMCMDCSGSRKVFVEDEKKTARCGECNENGLILCPICG